MNPNNMQYILPQPMSMSSDMNLSIGMSISSSMLDNSILPCSQLPEFTGACYDMNCMDMSSFEPFQSNQTVLPIMSTPSYNLGANFMSESEKRKIMRKQIIKSRIQARFYSKCDGSKRSRHQKSLTINPAPYQPYFNQSLKGSLSATYPSSVVNHQIAAVTNRPSNNGLSPFYSTQQNVPSYSNSMATSPYEEPFNSTFDTTSGMTLPCGIYNSQANSNSFIQDNSSMINMNLYNPSYLL